MQKYPNTPYTSSTTHHSDEIDLLELFGALKKHIKLIIGTTTIFLCLSLIYAISTTPTYQTNAIIIEPSTTELHKIDEGSNLLKLTPKSELQRLYLTLLNQDLKYQFFIDNVYQALPSNPISPLSAYNEFKKNLTITKSQGKKATHNYIELNYQSNNAQDTERVLKEYIDFANTETAKSIHNEYTTAIQKNINKTQSAINEKLDSAKFDIRNEIIRLEEASKIAHALNIETTSSPEAINGMNLNSGLTSYSLPIYTLGHKAIDMRISLLKDRKDIESFIPGLTKLIAKLNTYRNIQIQTNNIQLFSFEKSPTTPYAPIKPKKTLITILGTLLGVIFGCLIALIQFFIHRKHEELPSNNETQADSVSFIASIKQPKSLKNSIPTN